MSNFNKAKHFLVILVLLLRALGQAKAAPSTNILVDNISAADELELGAFINAADFEADNAIESKKLITADTRLEYSQNPEELGTYLEGDIVTMPPQNATLRNGMLAKNFRWPGAIVPYEIKGQFAAQELAIINHAFQQYHTRTCVRFRLRTSADRDYISIIKDKVGCWSNVGRIGGRQEVNLQAPLCLRTYGTTIHELMHALGFVHEQNRSERDGYVRVMSANIKPDMMINFEKQSAKTVNGFGVAYDYGSVMHYSPNSFSKNGSPTLMALKNTKESQLMGQRKGFSEGDVKKINAMYHCK